MLDDLSAQALALHQGLSADHKPLWTLFLPLSWRMEGCPWEFALGLQEGLVQYLTSLSWVPSEPLRFLPGQIPRVLSCSVWGAVPFLMDVRPPGGPHIGHPGLTPISVPFLVISPWQTCAKCMDKKVDSGCVPCLCCTNCMDLSRQPRAQSCSLRTPGQPWRHLLLRVSEQDHRSVSFGPALVYVNFRIITVLPRSPVDFQCLLTLLLVMEVIY